MTTQIAITTHEQAELHLRRNNAVSVVEGQPVVDGKTLLDVCGYSYTDRNWGSVLQRQLDKHGYTEGEEYVKSITRSNVGIGGRARVVVHIKLNAANHILLAAMTPEGHDARQEAIDMRNETNNTSSDPITVLLQSMLATRLCAEAQEQRIAHQEERVSHVEQAVQSIETRMDNQGCDEGFMPRAEAFRKYGRGLSKETFYALLVSLNAEVEIRPLTITTDNFVTNTVQVHEEDVKYIVEWFYNDSGLEQVTATRYTHPLFGTRRFQA